MRQRLLSVLLAVAALFSSGVANAQVTSTQDINLSATVTSYCTINGAGGAATAVNQTIPVTAAGAVNTTPIVSTIASVACNNSGTIVAASQSGGVRTVAAAAPGATNIIDYTASAVFGTGTSNLNTATVATAAGVETGSTGTITQAATGNLVVTVTPQTPGLPLQPGSYSDILRVTLTPN